jgi:hypothetical protein
MPAIEFVAARYRLGLESGESLRSLGEVLLADGHDEAVRLAIVENPVMADVGPLFEEVCAELGQPIPPLSEAVDTVITAILRGIVDGTIVPERGLTELVDDVYAVVRDQDKPGGYAGESRGLQHLIGARWGYDDLRDRPTELSIDGELGEAAIPLLDDNVRRYASDWLAAH